MEAEQQLAQQQQEQQRLQQLQQAEQEWRATATPEQIAYWERTKAEIEAKAAAHAATLVVGAKVILVGAPDELIEMQGGAVGEIISIDGDGGRVVQFPATVSPPLRPEHFLLATEQQVQQQTQQAQQQVQEQEQEQGERAWRFGQYDRVHCNIGGDAGWASGNVQAVDQQTEEGSLPYVVMLDPPIKELISVPADADFCVLPSVCFAESPAGGPCAAKIASEATVTSPTRRRKLRFAVGDRVACLCAGPDGTDWPRRWMAATVGALWHQPTGAADGAALPYLLDLDAVDTCGRWEQPEPVLVHRDDCMYVRSLDLQPPGECTNGVALQRFATRRNEEMGVDERVDHQTLVVRKVSPPAWTDSDSD
eukprot:COSAG06_NODE_1428_length_9487_cov_195.907861_2_plen_365_part_00